MRLMSSEKFTSQTRTIGTIRNTVSNMSKSKLEAPVTVSSSPEPVEKKTRKRKTADTAAPVEELEIDPSLPEPPSKRAKRLERKKGKPKTAPAEISEAAQEIAAQYAKRNKKPKPVVDEEEDDEEEEEDAALVGDSPPPIKSLVAPTGGVNSEQPRSDHGIWIGNLPFSATRETLRKFLLDQAKITDAEIVRLHLPVPVPDKAHTQRFKAANKGFAYIDFTTPEILEKALALSEKLITGRACLIKNAKSFEGRPEKPAPGSTEEVLAQATAASGKSPTKRIFVGNLGFDVTKEELEEHFAQAGEVEDVHMATFEDSGKCKGFAWVRFAELEAAAASVRGWIMRDSDQNNDDDVDDESEDEEGRAQRLADAVKGAGAKGAKKKKQRKWFLNKLHQRPLRCEFAEDAQTRYKKRYGKSTTPKTNTDGPVIRKPEVSDRRDDGAGGAGERQLKPDSEQRKAIRRQKHVDARTVAPGAALAGAQRATGAIVKGKGTKTTF